MICDSVFMLQTLVHSLKHLVIRIVLATLNLSDALFCICNQLLTDRLIYMVYLPHISLQLCYHLFLLLHR